MMMNQSVVCWTLLTATCMLLLCIIEPHEKNAFVVDSFSLLSPVVSYASSRSSSSRSRAITWLTRGSTDDGDKKKKRRGGYQFGDITKSIGKSLTGKDTYEFGDISRWMDQKAKSKVQQMTGKESYEFGDITKSITGKESYQFGDITKSLVANYTGKANYTVGDLSKEISRRVQAGEYHVQDVVLAFRALLQVGVSISPLASILPIRWLLQLLNLGLAQDIGGRFVEVIAQTLDKRVKQALTGNEDYQLGDYTKHRLSQSISKVTGKEFYEFGDITRALTRSSDKQNHQQQAEQQKIVEELATSLDRSVGKDLELWDEKFLKFSQEKKESKN